MWEYNLVNEIEWRLDIMSTNQSMPETKRDKFVRLAENRTNKILDMLQLLGNLSNPGTYEYTQNDVEKIFTAIENATKDAKKRYSKVETKASTRFTLE